MVDSLTHPVGVRVSRRVERWLPPIGSEKCTMSEQKRIGKQLDQLVAERTRELAEANEALKKELAVERQRTEAARRAIDQDSRLIVGSIPGLVSVLTPTGAVEAVNDQLVEYCGQTLEELKQWGTTDTVHPDDLPGVIQMLTQALASGEPYDFEGRLRRFDGAYRWFQVRALPLRDTNGTILRWYALHTDIEASPSRGREDDRRRVLRGNAIGQGAAAHPQDRREPNCRDGKHAHLTHDATPVTH